MPFEVQEEKTYEKPAADLYAAALKAIAGLEGQVDRQKPENGEIEAKFDKKILGKVLGERTHLAVKVSSPSGSGSTIAIEAYPLDPVGRKLMFGARKGVTGTVVSWFFAHLEHHLGK